MSIETNGRLVVLQGRHPVTIFKHFEVENAEQFISRTEKNEDGLSKTNSPTYRLAETMTILLRGMARMMARTVQEGTVKVKSIPNTSNENRFGVAKREV